jgi:hypothetical protein
VKALAAVALACAALTVHAGAASAAPAPPPPPAPSLTGPPPGIEVGPPLPDDGAAPRGGKEFNGDGKDDDPGLFDIPGKVREAVNDWFRGLVEDALRPSLELVGKTLLATPRVVGEERIRQLWQVVAGIANALLVLAALAAAALAMTHESVQTRYSIKEVLPRLFVAAVLVNASLALSGQMIAFANALSTGLVASGADAVQASERLATWVVAAVSGGGIFLIFLGLACAGFAVVLLVLYIVRAALIVLLVVAAPIMLLAHALPQTEGLAHMWWRAMIAALSIQVAQALTLAVAVSVFFTPDGHSALGLSATGGLIDLLVALCLLWVLLKIPFWAKEAVFSGRRSTIATTVRTYVVAKGVRAAAVAAA